MKPLQHIYQIRPEDIISELSPTDVRIGKLEIEVERLKELIIKQTDINKNIIDMLKILNNEIKVSE